MDFWKLFIVALMPNLKVLLVTAFGSLLALDRFNILTHNAGKHMNTMVYYAFLPALICGNLAKAINLSSLVTLWFMLISAVLSFIIGIALGHLLMKIINVPSHLKGLVLGCCAAGNVGNLLLIIVPSICKEKNSPLGEVDVCYKDGLAHASLLTALSTIYIWTYVHNIIRNESLKVKADETLVKSMGATKLDNEKISTCSIEALVIGDKSEAKDTEKHVENKCTISRGQPEVPKKEKRIKQLKIFVEKFNLKALYAPYMIATIVGLIIGVIPQFRKLLVVDNAPLHVVQDSIIMLGDACIPVMTLLVGANLIKGLKGIGKLVPLIVGIIVVRYIALPIIGIGIVQGAVHFGLIKHDPLYMFLLLLQFPPPPAVSISTMTQLFGVGEGECSVIMVATYLVATISITLWSAFFLWFIVQ